MQNNSTIWEACELYGRNIILPAHNNPALFSKWLDNLRDLETQLLCDQDGEKVEGKNKWIDDAGQEFGPIRWPYKAKTPNPEFRDYPRKFLFDDHLLAIGSTGWNWTQKESRWLGFDFDALVGHAAGVGVDDAELARVAKAAPDFVDVIQSTRGAGKHLYVFFDAPYPKTATHTEHAAIARAFLPVMSAAAGFDFSTKMDVCGSILWLWHRDATTDNRGFTCIKNSTRHVTAQDVPPNWRDHLDVVSGKRGRVRVRGWSPEGEVTDKRADEDTEAYPVIQLDECHKRFLTDLEDTGYTYYWVHDHHLAQTHTCAIKQVHDAWAKAGHPMKGPYDTTAPGTDKGKPNTYLRPRLGGGWDCFRFGEGIVAEHPLWDDFNNKTHITLNIGPSLRQGALAAGGVECADLKHGFQLPDVESLYIALDYLGSDFRLSDHIRATDRSYHLKTRQGDDRIIVQVERKREDLDIDFLGWEKKNATTWQKLLSDHTNTKQDEDQTAAYWDNKIRLVKVVSMAETGSVAGEADTWLIKDSSGKWVRHPKDNVILVVNKKAGTAAIDVLASAIDNAWTKVNKPFEPEYTGGREWNYAAPQYVYQPRLLKNGEVPHHPHWDLVFNHCGAGLDKYILDLPWCKEWGIKTGGDYLRRWLAAMLRFPYCRLPYLFMYSEAQNTGKTTWHEMIRLLVTHGVEAADKALTSAGDFNGELTNVLLGTIDETDIAKAGKSVYNKVKDWTTANRYSIHGKYKEVYVQPNILHLIQTANHRQACPVYGGDTRITSIEVSVIKERVAEETLKEGCRSEGGDFMATLMSLPLPKHSDRMRVPVIDTDSKAAAISDHRDELEAFIEDNCTYVPGNAVKFEEFFTAFLTSLEKFERKEWPRGIVKATLPDHFPYGRYSRNVNYIGNMAIGTDLEPTEVGKARFVLSVGKLVKES